MNIDDYALTDFIGKSSPDVFEKLDGFWDFIGEMKRSKPGQYLCERARRGVNGPRLELRDGVFGKWREYVMLGSNDYLGLSGHPEVIAAGVKALQDFGTGSTGTALFSGATVLQEELERSLAEFKGREAALVFPSGYSANLGVLTGLLRPGDVVVNDKLNHASIIDGCRLSGAELRVFRHGDMDSLEDLLERISKGGKGVLVAVDSVFSMDGDTAPLDELVPLAHAHGARVLVDEAHAVGVFGEGGGGVEQVLCVEDRPDAVVGTLSKAVGCVGGFAVGSERLINYLRFYARSYMFSAALPPPVVASARAALDVIRREDWRRKRLWENAEYLCKGLRERGVDVDEPRSAIIPVMVGDELVLREVAEEIARRGVFVNTVVYPAVPQGAGRLRLSLMATHTKEDLDFAIETISEVFAHHALTQRRAAPGAASHPKQSSVSST